MYQWSWEKLHKTMYNCV
uniref:Uncharacterized protein n=1 Tax=Anguilla anguilla TaxID=7936 RepID=A0A0E9VBJ1_ANGAN